VQTAKEILSGNVKETPSGQVRSCNCAEASRVGFKDYMYCDLDNSRSVASSCASGCRFIQNKDTSSHGVCVSGPAVTVSSSAMTAPLAPEVQQSPPVPCEYDFGSTAGEASSRPQNVCREKQPVCVGFSAGHQYGNCVASSHPPQPVPSASPAAAVDRHLWKEYLDPKTNRHFEVHSETGETRWKVAAQVAQLLVPPQPSTSSPPNDPTATPRVASPAASPATQGRDRAEGGTGGGQDKPPDTEKETEIEACVAGKAPSALHLMYVKVHTHDACMDDIHELTNSRTHPVPL
jgi:hypothetical protein